MGDLTSKLSLKSSPEIDNFIKNWDKTATAMVTAGNLFTSFFVKDVSSTSSYTCNLFKAETNKAPGLLTLPTSTDYKKSYTEISTGLPDDHGN